MAVLRCEKGHFYDGDKFAECPHCKTPLPTPRRLGEAVTEYRPSLSRPSATGVQVQFGPAAQGEEKTVGVYRTTLGCDPVVGWLVCVEGKEKGRDYRLHAGRNSIGRALDMDIALPDDPAVSREEHCSLVFEPQKTIFALVRGRGEVLLLNGEPLGDSVCLQGGERLTIGAGVFVFVPFCREGLVW